LRTNRLYYCFARIKNIAPKRAELASIKMQQITDN